MATRASAQTTSKAAQGLLPQLEAAIAYLNEEIAQIRSGQRDQSLHDLIADPLPREQFRGLLQVWKLPPVPVELSKLFVQLEELRDKEKKERDEKQKELARESESVDTQEATVTKTQEETETLGNATEGTGAEPAEEEEVDDDGMEDAAEGESVEEKSEAEDATQPEQQPPRRPRGRPGRRQPLPVKVTDDGKEVVAAVEAEAEEEEAAVAENPTKSPPKTPSEMAEVASAPAEGSQSAEVSELPSPSAATAPARVVDSPSEVKKISSSSTMAMPPATHTPSVPASAPTSTSHVATQAATPAATTVPALTPTTAQVQAPAPTKADAAREIALVNLRALRRSMMLDVLSKIVSVAKSKGVDPAMFSSRANATGNSATDAPARSSFVDLEMIQREVSKGSIAEWEHFAQQVYLFCQHVIAESEKQDRQDAKQKGVELLHFAKTLTETLRKASLKKEETIMRTTPTTTPTAAAPSITQVHHAPVRPTLPPVVVSNPIVSLQPPGPAPETTATKVESGLADSADQSDSLSASKTLPRPPVPGVVASKLESNETPVPSATVVGSPSSGATPADSVTTPHRMSTRLRHRENSVDSPSPSRRRTARAADDDQTDGAAATTSGGIETRTRKRPRGATPSTVQDEHSASESQQSTSEAPNTTGADATDAKPRTRKRRPILPATRMSSRQQKRRATQAAKAAAAAAKEDGDEGGDDTKDEDSDAEDHDDAATEENEEDDAESDATPSKEKTPSANVPLTKSGRPRKKPGRKPKKPQDGK